MTDREPIPPCVETHVPSIEWLAAGIMGAPLALDLPKLREALFEFRDHTVQRAVAEAVAAIEEKRAHESWEAFRDMVPEPTLVKPPPIVDRGAAMKRLAIAIRQFDEAASDKGISTLAGFEIRNAAEAVLTLPPAPASADALGALRELRTWFRSDAFSTKADKGGIWIWKPDIMHELNKRLAALGGAQEKL